MADDVAPDAAPSSAPAAAPAAPSTPTTTSTPDVKRASSFRAALETADAGASSAPPEDASVDPSPAAASVLPTDAVKAAPGPIPYDRFDQVNQAKKAAETKLQALAWAEGIDRQALADTVRWRQLATTDPGRFLNEVWKSAPPNVQAQFRQVMAPQASAPATAEKPQPDLVTGDGEPVYSAKQQERLDDWRDQQRELKFNERFAPLQQELNTFKRDRETVARTAKSQAFATKTLAEVAEWPHYADHKQAIAEAYAASPPGDGSETAELLALHKAYVAVMKRDVLPTLETKTKDAVNADLRMKAVAQSEHPGRAVSTDTKRPGSMGEAIRQTAAATGFRF